MCIWLTAALCVMMVGVSSHAETTDGKYPSLKYRLWKDAKRQCVDAEGRCFLKWSSAKRAFPLAFILDYKRSLGDGFVVPCPAGYHLEQPQGLDPFRMCYPSEEDQIFYFLGRVSPTIETMFGLPNYCTIGDPCFEDRYHVVNVTGVQLNGVDGVDGFGEDTVHAISLGFNSLGFAQPNARLRHGRFLDVGEDGSVSLSVRLSRPSEVLDYADLLQGLAPTELELSFRVVTLCSLSEETCRDSVQSSLATSISRVPPSEFFRLLNANPVDQACAPFRLPSGIRALFCQQIEGQLTHFASQSATKKAVASDEFDDYPQPKKTAAELTLFLW